MKKPAKEYVYVVAGSGEFPEDMLRYDESRAVRPEDQAVIDARYGAGDHILFGEDKHLKTNIVVLVTTSRFAPTNDRWRSFMWSVIRGPSLLLPNEDSAIRARAIAAALAEAEKLVLRKMAKA